MEAASNDPSASVSEELSATRRALAIPELVQLIGMYLKRDRIDLVTLSGVCRQFRQVAMPLLLQELDLPLSSVGRFLAAFRTRPARRFLQHIRFLRLWDDETVHLARSEDGTVSRGDRSSWRRERQAEVSAHRLCEQHDPRWTVDVYELFDILSTTQARDLPRIDLTFHIVSALALKHLFQEFSELAEQVVALRAIDRRLDDTDAKVLGREAASLNAHACQWWQSAVDVVRAVTEAQNVNAKRYFQVFALESYQVTSSASTCRRSIWTSLVSLLRSRITDLTLHLNAPCIAPEDRATLLEDVWPQLVHVQLKTPDIWPSETRIVVQKAINAFLKRHQHLEHIRLLGDPDMTKAFLNRDWPRLRHLTTPFVEWTADAQSRMLSHALPLEELDFGYSRTDRSIDVPGADVPPARHLQYLYGNKSALCWLFRAGFSCSHLDLDLGDYMEIAEAVIPKLSAAQAARITCLTAYTQEVTINEITVMLGAVINGSTLPELTELVLRPDTSGDDLQAEEHLRRVLLAVRSLKKLRALYVDWLDARPLNTAQLANCIHEEDFPAALEYVAWQVPDGNRTQYFRVHKAPYTLPYSPRYVVSKRQLKPLPYASRLRVNQDGVWNRSAYFEADRVLLDHSVFPPRLLA